MDIEKNSTEISNEISATLKLMKKAKTAEDKLKYSAAVKNLCESLGVFFDFFGNLSPLGIFDDDDDDDDYDEPDDNKFSGPIPF